MKKDPRGYGFCYHKGHYHHLLPHWNQGHICRITGSMNTSSLNLGLFYWLSSQETQQDLAYKKGHHIVEFFEECSPLPTVVACPQWVLSKEPESEVLDIKLDWKEVKT